MTTPYMSLAWPVPGLTAGPNYAAQQVSAIDLIDAHDHTPGRGALVPSTGLNINADLPFAGFDAAGLRMARFENQSGVLGSGNIRGVYVVGGELYYNDGSGTAVQITSGGSVAGAAGNISGLASPAAVTWDSVNKIFAFTQQASFPAKIQGGDLILYETAASPSNAVTVKSPASLASAYSLTLPAAVPATNALLYGTTGVALTFLAAPAATSLLQQTAAGSLSWVTTLPAGLTIPAADVFKSSALADSSATLVLVAGTRYVAATLTANRTKTFDSSGIGIGQRVSFFNADAAQSLILAADDGLSWYTLAPHEFVELEALANTPADGTEWAKVHGSERLRVFTELTLTFTADAGADTIDLGTDDGLADAETDEYDKAFYASTDGTLPAGLAASTPYYLVNIAAATSKLSLTPGGAAIDITDAGSGTHTLTPQWVVPLGVQRAAAEVIGGGGGGGPGSAGSVSGPGAGGGGSAIGALAVTPASAVAVTIGPGGAANAAGSDSTVATLTGGGGAAGGVAGSALGAGGSATGGAANVTGQCGEAARVGGNENGGHGGGTTKGGGGLGSYGVSNGSNGKTYGGGGGGGSAIAGKTTGGVGAAGVALLTY